MTSALPRNSRATRLGVAPKRHQRADFAAALGHVGEHRAGDAGDADDQQDREEQVRELRHQPIDGDLRVDDLRDRHDLGVGKRVGELADESAGRVFAAGHDFDDVDRFALLGEPLDRVQVGEDAAVVDGAGGRHHARDLEVDSRAA